MQMDKNRHKIIFNHRVSLISSQRAEWVEGLTGAHEVKDWEVLKKKKFKNKSKSDEQTALIS